MLYPTRSAAVPALALVLASVPLLAKSAPSLPTGQVAQPAGQVALRGAPAFVDGLWCGAGLLRDFTLEIVQQTQSVHARLIRRGKVREITGRVDGTRLRTDPQRNETMELLADGDQLRITAATGVLALTRGQFFTRATGASCAH